MAVMEVTLALIAVVGLILSGLSLAVPQWLILRRHVRQSRHWLQATMGGMLAGVIIGGGLGTAAFVVSENVLRGFLLTLQGNTWDGPYFLSAAYVTASAWGAEVGKLAGGAIAGSIVGASQRVVLRAQFPRADWWVLASMIGGAVMSPWLVAGFQRQSAGILASSLFGVGGGASYGIVIGIALGRLMRHTVNARLETG